MVKYNKCLYVIYIFYWLPSWSTMFSLLSFVDHLFNLKFAVKELERNSKKCEKEEKAEKLKTKKAIQKGNMEVLGWFFFTF